MQDTEVEKYSQREQWFCFPHNLRLKSTLKHSPYIIQRFDMFLLPRTQHTFTPNRAVYIFKINAAFKHFYNRIPKKETINTIHRKVTSSQNIITQKIRNFVLCFTNYTSEPQLSNQQVI